jgi:hypothetical protein
MTAPRSEPLRSRLQAGAVLLVLAAAAFLAATAVPYRVDSDIAFQIKPIEQWLQGVTPTPFTLRLPDPQDLSRDSSLWSNWWPPALPLLYTPLAAAGLPLANALRVTSLLLFLAGSFGWLQLGERAGLSGLGRPLYAVSLAAYALTIGGAATLHTADLPAYAAGPWLILLALRQGERETGPGRLFLGGLALGATYWVRYALFLTSLPLLAWVAIRNAGAVRLSRWRWSFRLRHLAALGLGFALPVLVLFLLNLRQAALAETVSGARSLWHLDRRAAHPLFLALSVLGSPGLGAFQGDLWITHLAYFSDAWLPWVRNFGEIERLALKAVLGLPGTLALAWALYRARRRASPLAPFATLLAAGFYAALALVSLLVGYNYLLNEPRLAAGLVPLLQAILIAECLAAWRDARAPRTRAIAALALTVVFAVPTAFAAASFAKKDLHDRYTLRYRTSRTGLFMPELAERDVPTVRAVVAANLRSPRDVVVLAGYGGWGDSAFVPWLEFPQRTFPVAPFFEPLGVRYVAAADLRGTATFRSSRPLRLVLVLARALVQDGTLSRLEGRVPQARLWTAVPLPAGANVAVYFSDLEVP